MDGLYPDDAHDARTSAIIPVLGLSPHGEFHVCHAGYRLFSPIIQVFGDTCSEYVIELSQTPGAESFDHAPAFLRAWAVLSILNLTTEGGCGRKHLDRANSTSPSRSPFSGCRRPRPDYVMRHVAPAFLRACERNIDLAWVVHMLYDFLFMWWDFKQAVRANASKHIDVLWAEFVPMGRTTTANKTHYGVLALMQVYLGCALHPELD
eukprot:CAMPEP_0182834102 /NCGR_PEP_ID=MMETSP0006_2-20121128/20719_1 /TAXON_ID=97485 /ORGANISM="Prymnesium parvum, Strain Texoma1" /LENGTH=206 /DNA_ID=CAMNT_0024962293 /DNA_START=601 /DNA_END=1220 /DNA_ORIENTATION=-